MFQRASLFVEGRGGVKLDDGACALPRRRRGSARASFFGFLRRHRRPSSLSFVAGRRILSPP